MKKVDHPNLASVHEVIDVTSDDALLSASSLASPVMQSTDARLRSRYAKLLAFSSIQAD